MELLNRSRAAALAAALLATSVPLLAAPQAAVAQQPTVECDGKWHYEPVGDPVFKREIADKLTFDNRKGSEPRDETVRTKESLTKKFSHKVDLGYEISAEASSSFGIFSASVKSKFSASYGFAFAETNSVERETEIRLTAGVGVGYIRYVGIETVEVTGYYERILDCDKKTQRYQRIGPVTEEAPIIGKAVWTEALPDSK
ncbi:hypothetical protein [Kitasatospora sp. NPDC093558]|uniref:hypothetical protein n=1 Tax=Kitasatospora sp. NPDC093558 TaxID=3155201 RepID=UPI0034319F50